MDPRAFAVDSVLSSLILRLRAKGAVLCIFEQNDKAQVFAATDDSFTLPIEEALLKMAVQVEQNRCKMDKAHIPVPPQDSTLTSPAATNN